MIETESQARSFVQDRCDRGAFRKIELFSAALSDEAQRQNLVSRVTLEHAWQRHVADSAQLLDNVPRETSSSEPTFLDLGSGAGLPGLIIAIMRPAWQVVLVESRKRRSQWLQRMVGDLRLVNCTVVGQRLETIDSFNADIISARAFASLPKLLNLAGRFSTAQTLWLLPKGRSARQELLDLPMYQQKMFHVEQSQTEPDAGIVIGHWTPGGQTEL